MDKAPTTKRVLKFLLGLRRVAPGLCLIMAISQTVFTVLDAAIAPIFISKLLTSITSGDATLSGSISLLAMYGGILLLSVIMPRITIMLAFKTETAMQSHVLRQIFKHLSSQSLDFHANKMSGSLVSDTSKLVSAIERFWDTIIFMAIPIVTTVLAIFVSLSFIIWQYALVLLVLSILTITAVIKLQGYITPISQEVAKRSSKITAFLADTISNISVVKAFSRESSESKRQNMLINQRHSSLMREMKRVLLATGSMGSMMAVLNIVAFAVAIIAVEHQLANIGTIYLVISYTLRITSQLWQVSNSTRNYVRVIGDASPMIATLDQGVELKDVDNPINLKVDKGEIEFRNVDFRYPDSPTNLFSNLNITIKPGERIGLVGHSGSGKTSLSKLLLRFCDINSGEILIDGQNIAIARQTDLHESIAYVPQEPMLFHRTLRENIAYAKPKASDKEIIKVVKQANAYEFIKDLPDGLNTIVGERGVKLSGGQRQRIAIARAILKDAPILVLDEATSALDSESERLIQDALKKLMKNRTSIVIAHRLSTIANLNRIIVLNKGKIIEQGSHKQLLDKPNGVYAKLWQRQSGGFIEE